jgi:hypothetical protein
MLCRACGQEMVAFEYCLHCNEVIHWRCGTCGKENEKSVHTHYLQEDDSRISSSELGAAASVVAIITTTTTTTLLSDFSKIIFI